MYTLSYLRGARNRGMSVIVSNLFQASYLMLHHLCRVFPIKDFLIKSKHLYFHLTLLH